MKIEIVHKYEHNIWIVPRCRTAGRITVSRFWTEVTCKKCLQKPKVKDKKHD